MSTGHEFALLKSLPPLYTIHSCCLLQSDTCYFYFKFVARAKEGSFKEFLPPI